MTDTEQTTGTPGERNWTEDFDHENGQYRSICHICGNPFLGHKRRVSCKLCQRTPAPGVEGGVAGRPEVTEAARMLFLELQQIQQHARESGELLYTTYEAKLRAIDNALAATRLTKAEEALAELVICASNFWIYLGGEHGVNLSAEEYDDHNVYKFFAALKDAALALTPPDHGQGEGAGGHSE